MASLSMHSCNENEINEIVKLLKDSSLEGLKLTKDREDGEIFIYAKIKSMILQFQERLSEKENLICFFSLQINSDSYEVAYPKGELLKELRKILIEAKDKVLYGKSLSEKIKNALLTPSV